MQVPQQPRPSFNMKFSEIFIILTIEIIKQGKRGVLIYFRQLNNKNFKVEQIEYFQT